METKFQVGDFVTGGSVKGKTFEDCVWWKVIALSGDGSTHVRVKPIYIGKNIEAGYVNMIRREYASKTNGELSRVEFFRKAKRKEAKMLDFAQWEPI